MSVDLYSPWREPAAAAARHVGRRGEIDAIARHARAFAAGGQPLPVYLFGPRGVGKSHLLTLLGAQLQRELGGVHVVWVPEDIPEERVPERLIERMESGVTARRWTRWGTSESSTLGTPPRRPSTRRGEGVAPKRVVLFEGLDRQLHALGAPGRHALRRLLDERDDLWIIATGVSLSVPFTGREEAFYGAFDLRPLEPLDDAEAAQLLDALVAPSAPDALLVPPEGPVTWPARRDTLIALAGGNARALTALAISCREHPGRWASQQLHDVLRHFTAHYQMRFRDLSPQHQQMVALLAESPRELTPSDLAAELDSSTSQMSVQAGRLVEDGVLRQRTSEIGGRDKRQTWYRLAEPLFRFWLEYRNSGWDETRAGWLGRLLETLMTPRELADAWWTHPDHDIWKAAGRMLSPEQTRDAWKRLYQQARDPEALPELVRRAAGLRHHKQTTALVPAFVLQVLQADRGALLDDELRDALGREPRYREMAALIDFERDVRDEKASLREAFIAFVEQLAALQRDADPERSLLDLEPLLMACVTVLGRRRRGGPWKLRDSERALLATIPVLRGYFAEHGRLAGHGPLLAPEDLLAALDAQPRGALIDAGPLILTGVVTRCPPLTQRAAEAFDGRAAWAFAPCPLPAEALPAAAAEAVLAAAQRSDARTSAGPHRGSAWMTWAASVANVSEARLSELLAASPPEAPSELEHQTEIALASLAMRDAACFARVQKALAALGEPWAELCEQAALLADQLSEADRGRLHPELEWLRAAFSAG